MLDLSKVMKTTAVAAFIGSAALALATPASAATYTRCDGNGCYRVHCDWDGDNCYRVSGYYNSGYDYYGYGPTYYGDGYYRSERVCDAWGCHYVRRYEPRSSVEFGFRF